MQKNHMKFPQLNLNLGKPPTFKAMMASIAMGIFISYVNVSFFNVLAAFLSDAFIRLFSMLSVPTIFFSISSTIIGMSYSGENKIGIIFSKIMKYTLFTTFLSSGLAVIIFIAIDPTSDMASIAMPTQKTIEGTQNWSYLDNLLDIIPSNILGPFVDGKIPSILFIAVIMSLAILKSEEKNKSLFRDLFNGFYDITMSILSYVVSLMPLVVWAFIVKLSSSINMDESEYILSLGKYIGCILLAVTLHTGITLSLIMKFKGLHPIEVFRKILPGVSLAFFTRSSNASVPTSIQSAETHGINSEVARFSFPILATINMNACSVLIAISILFSKKMDSIMHGTSFRISDMLMSIPIAIMCAMGNAGVPMGCVFISIALIQSANLSADFIIVLTPLLAIFDMYETGCNVASDGVIVHIIDKEMKDKKKK